MNIDFKLLHKFFFWNVIGMIVVVAGDLYFEGRTYYGAVLLPFINTPIMYFLGKKYKLYGLDKH